MTAALVDVADRRSQPGRVRLLLRRARPWSPPPEPPDSASGPLAGGVPGPISPDGAPPEIGEHIASHAAFLDGVRSVSSTLLRPSTDLLVLPTSRPDPAQRNGLRTAIDLARAGCLRRLLVLCSKQAAAPEARRELQRTLAAAIPANVAVAVTVVTGNRPAVPRFAVDQLPISTFERRYARPTATSFGYTNDVGLKRNLAVMLAARLRMRYLLFLDDDVRPLPSPTDPSVEPEVTGGPTLDPWTLAAATSALLGHDRRGRGLSAVGWVLRGYHDNSVVCRVRRLVGHDQDQFIGGGALLVRSPAGLPFFPAIYNEDWLFLLAMIGIGHLPKSVLGCGGVVLQDRYDGYRPIRARSEELGDILGETLMSVLHRGGHPLDDPLDAKDWRAALAGRQAMIRRLVTETMAITPDESHERESAVQALGAALAVHEKIDERLRHWAAQFAAYVPAWQKDLASWRSHLALGTYGDNTDLLPEQHTTVSPGGAAAFGLPDTVERSWPSPEEPAMRRTRVG